MYVSLYACFIGSTILFVLYTFVIYDDVLCYIVLKWNVTCRKYPLIYIMYQAYEILKTMLFMKIEYKRIENSRYTTNLALKVRKVLVFWNLQNVPNVLNNGLVHICATFIYSLLITIYAKRPSSY